MPSHTSAATKLTQKTLILNWQDFLTQSFAPRSKPSSTATPYFNPGFEPLNRVPSRTESLAPSFVSTSTFAPSIMTMRSDTTATTTNTTELHQTQNENFSLLRTAFGDDQGRGRLEEEVVEIPDVKKGDIRSVLPFLVSLKNMLLTKPLWG
jgi:hypothetical protein